MAEFIKIKKKNNMEQTAVNWLVSQLNKKGFAQVVTDEEINQAKEMEEQQSQEYAEFCINCYREDYPILDFESYIKVKERYGQSNI